MKKTILYAVIAAAVAAIAVVGCNGDFGNGNADSDAFLDKFHSNKRLKKFTVTYNGNGNDSGAVPTGTQHDSGTYVTVKGKGSLVRIGYNFTKWATQPNGSGATYTDGGGFRISKDVTLYAQWMLATTPLFKVEVSSSIGGTGTSGSGDYAQGDLVTIDAGTAPDGCMFLNWTVTSGNVTVADDREPTTTFTMPDSKVTIMAVFGVTGGETGWLNDVRDGKSYRTVRIGEQTWMAQNLNFEPVSGSGCFYVNVDDCNTYGRMYNWDAAMTACPTGWHLPTREEWGDLAIAVGGIGEYGEQGTAGTRLKAKEPDWDGTDDYGFSALPGGENHNGEVMFPSGIGSWWIAKGGGASHRVMDGDAVSEYGDGANYWLSVRCVKGDAPPEIELVAPSDIVATVTTYSITLNWFPVRRATGYFVYRRTNLSDKYESIAVIKSTSYTDNGLTQGTTYYYKVSAYNSNGDEGPLSSEVSATTGTITKITGKFTDLRNNNEYKTATIEGKTWMAENLNFDPQKGNSWCYDGEDSKCKEYGRLYDWATAMDLNTAFNGASWGGSDVKRQGVCPTGWHLPSKQEWTDLVTATGGSGNRLKSNSGWNDNDDETGNGTDDYGFSALPGGRRYSDGSFSRAGNDGYWWTATEYDGGDAYNRFMNYDGVYEGYYGGNKSYGYSVRCVKDE